MFRQFVRYALVFAGTVLGWGWAIAKFILDWIGRSTIEDDATDLFEVRLPKALAWLFSTPAWVPTLLAIILTAYLIYISWPSTSRRSSPPFTDGSQPQVRIENINIQHSDKNQRNIRSISEQVRTVAYVNFSIGNASIASSYNIRAIVERSSFEYQFLFENPLNKDTLVVLPVGETGPFEVLGVSETEVSLRLTGDPSVVQFRFDSVELGLEKQISPD